MALLVFMVTMDPLVAEPYSPILMKPVWKLEISDTLNNSAAQGSTVHYKTYFRFNFQRDSL